MKQIYWLLACSCHLLPIKQLVIVYALIFSIIPYYYMQTNLRDKVALTLDWEVVTFSQSNISAICLYEFPAVFEQICCSSISFSLNSFYVKASRSSLKSQKEHECRKNSVAGQLHSSAVLSSDVLLENPSSLIVQRHLLPAANQSREKCVNQRFLNNQSRPINVSNHVGKTTLDPVTRPSYEFQQCSASTNTRQGIKTDLDCCCEVEISLLIIIFKKFFDKV